MFAVASAPSLSSRVRAGVLALDTVNLLWPLLVNEHTLDVASDTRCPLGQLWGRFSRGLKALGVEEDSAAAFGFDSPAALGERDGDADHEYETLSRLWRFVVRMRTEFPRVIAA